MGFGKFLKKAVKGVAKVSAIAAGVPVGFGKKKKKKVAPKPVEPKEEKDTVVSAPLEQPKEQPEKKPEKDYATQVSERMKARRQSKKINMA